MPPNDSRLYSYDAILREHAEIERDVSRFAKMRAEEVRVWPGGVRTLEQRLLRLRRRLERRFDCEERGGLFDEILARTPWVQCRVTTLKNQHGDFLRLLDQVVEALRGPEFPDLDQIVVRLHRFVFTYLRHEETENTLLLKSHNDEFGSLD